jgi:hypothetical protein
LWWMANGMRMVETPSGSSIHPSFSRTTGVSCLLSQLSTVQQSAMWNRWCETLILVSRNQGVRIVAPGRVRRFSIHSCSEETTHRPCFLSLMNPPAVLPGPQPSPGPFWPRKTPAV